MKRNVGAKNQTIRFMIVSAGIMMGLFAKRGWIKALPEGTIIPAIDEQIFPDNNPHEIVRHRASFSYSLAIATLPPCGQCCTVRALPVDPPVPARQRGPAQPLRRRSPCMVVERGGALVEYPRVPRIRKPEPLEIEVVAEFVAQGAEERPD